jgi:thiol-disulfide isomerase/thioredoxin/tetratricopeptide (TPR) repeat protein
MAISLTSSKPRSAPGTKSPIKRYWGSICLLLAVAAVGRAQTPTCPCEASPAVKAALNALDSPDIEKLPSKERKARRLAAITSLRQQFPADLFVERLYQEEHMEVRSSYGYYETAVIEEYRKLADDHKQDPLYLYLYARSLVGARTPEAIGGFDTVLRLSPGYAWADLALTNIYDHEHLEDKAKFEAHDLAFRQLCPKSLEGYGHLHTLRDTDFVKMASSEMRAKLEGDIAGRDIAHYIVLWQLELDLAKGSERDQVHKRILEDIARLKQNGSVAGTLRGMRTMKDGYLLAKDKEGQQWVDDQILAKFPDSSDAARIISQRWDAQHPRPEAGAPQEKWTDYYRAQLDRADARIKAHADDPSAWQSRFTMLTELKDRPIGEIEDTADHLVKALADSGSNFYSIPPVGLQVAQVYLDRDIRVDQIPDLVEGGLKTVRLRREAELKSDMLSPALRKSISRQLEYTNWLSWPVLASAYLKTKQTQKADEVVAAMEQALSKTKPDGSAQVADKADYKRNQGTYWEWNGRVAEAEGRKTDALAFYQHAIALQPYLAGATLAKAKTLTADSTSDDSLPGRAAHLWKELGGTAQGLEALMTPVDDTPLPSLGGWQTLAKPLPPFELSDLKGAKWNLASLKGKVAFVNVWATWCGPCQMELPHLQKLYDRMKDSKDVLVLTLNVDHDTDLIEPFVKDHKFTFPVVPAEDYIQDFLKTISIPRNWIVTPSGTLSVEEVGFGGDGDKWVDEAVKEIEKAKGK